jgi:hypothetical protein
MLSDNSLLVIKTATIFGDDDSPACGWGSIAQWVNCEKDAAVFASKMVATMMVET